MHVTVIGAGVAGLACAVELAERGATVELVDRGKKLGSASCSWYAGGMLTPWCALEGADPLRRHGVGHAGERALRDRLHGPGGTWRSQRPPWRERRDAVTSVARYFFVAARPCIASTYSVVHRAASRRSLHGRCDDDRERSPDAEHHFLELRVAGSALCA